MVRPAERESGAAPPRASRPLRVAVVDDSAINRDGTRSVLERTRGVEVVLLCDFEQALARQSWEDVDWVIVDVAHEFRADDETPCVPVIERIRAVSGRQAQPQVVAVTANPVAFNEPLIRRRLIEADPKVGLLWRRDLEQMILQAMSGERLGEEFERVPPTDAPSTVPELGVTSRTRMQLLHDLSRDIVTASSAGLSERKTWRLRDRAARDANLNPVNQDGLLARNSDTPSVRQFRRIWERFRITGR
jgi:CheY-like chemotaxis protein